MKTNLITLLLISLCLNNLQAQKADTTMVKAPRLLYGGMQQLGLVFTENNYTNAFLISNGVRFGRFYTGIAADMIFNRRANYYYYSDYNFNLSAVYADGRYYINKKKNFFAKAAMGFNCIPNNLGSSINYSYKKMLGYYGGVGIGFKARLGKEVFYTFDVNYTLRQTRYNYTYTNFRSEKQTDKFNLQQFALMINMGLEIF